MAKHKKFFFSIVTFLSVFFILVVGILVTFTQNVYASTNYYVSGTNGNDAWSGTLPDPNVSNTDGPFLTLARAQSVMQGSSIKTTIIRNGTYSIASVWAFTWKDSGETWIPYTGETPILEGSGIGGITLSGVSGFTMEGLTIQNTGTIGVYLSGGTTNITFRWNRFLRCVNACISGGGVTDVLIDSNTLDGQTPGNPSGNTGTAYSVINFWYGSSNNKITHNLFQNAEGGGIAFAAGPTDPPNNNNIVDRNILRNVDTNVVDNGAIYMMDRSHRAIGNQITNNIIDGNGGTAYLSNWTKAIYLDDDMSNVLVSGNICRNCGQYGLQIHAGDHNTVVNNIFDLTGGALLGFYQDLLQYGNYGMTGNVFRQNIVYFANSAPNPLWQWGQDPSDTLMTKPTDTTNLYYSSSGASIPNSGQIIDTNLVYANPLFTAPSVGDYSMPSNSPAYTQISFQALPTDQGPLSSPFSFPPPDTSAPSVPTGLSGTAVSSTQINLTWIASTDNVAVTGYNVFRNGTQVSTSTATAYSDIGLSQGTTYSYTVSSFDAAGNISAQSGVSIATTNQAPAPNFSTGSRVKTTADLNIRNKPSKSGKLLCTQPTGSLGTITSGPNISSGYTWWNVNYDVGCDGWSIQSYLTLVAVVTVAPITHTILIGSTGQEVITLQNFLTKLNFYSNQITGYFGVITETSVKNFQTANALDAVGIVGPKTRALLLQMMK